MTSQEELNWKERIPQLDGRLFDDRCLMHLVLYDGHCALCNATVRFLLRCDRKGKLMFASLQGMTARSLAPLLKHRAESIVLMSYLRTDREQVFEKSDAVLEIFRLLGGWWRAATLFRIVPRAVRDCVYNWIARHRFEWFGAYPYEQCPLPAPDHRARFLP